MRETRLHHDENQDRADGGEEHDSSDGDVSDDDDRSVGARAVGARCFGGHFGAGRTERKCRPLTILHS